MGDVILPVPIGSRDIDWSGTAIEVRPVADTRLFRLKQTRAGASGASAPLADLPGVGEASGTAAWLGPDEWLLFCSAERHEQLLSELRAVQDRRCGYWTELSDALTMLDLGADAAWIARLTGLPLSSLAPGRAARTRLAAIPMLFIIGTDGRGTMIFENSFDRHVISWLNLAT